MTQSNQKVGGFIPKMGIKKHYMAIVLHSNGITYINANMKALLKSYPDLN
jgi:hypothetical protein